MTSQQSLQLFDIVNRNFKTESDARLFVTEIDSLISSSFKDEATDLASRQDLFVVKNELLKEIADIKKEISSINKETALIRIDLVKEIAQSKTEFMREIAITNKEIATTNKEIVILKADLTKQIDASKIELIKWTFSFWITIVMLIIGAFFLRK